MHSVSYARTRTRVGYNAISTEVLRVVLLDLRVVLLDLRVILLEP